MDQAGTHLGEASGEVHLRHYRGFRAAVLQGAQLLPTAVETPKWETAKTTTPSPHHPLGAKGVGESATVGAPPAIVNAVVDALSHLGVRHIDIPMTPDKVWALLREHGVTE